MGAVLLGTDVTIRGVKTIGQKVGEKGQEVGKAAKTVKENAVNKATKLWEMTKTKAKEAKGAVVQGYKDTRDAVKEGIDTAGKWVDGKLEDGKNAVKAGRDAVVQGYKDAKTEISVRTDLGISTLQEGFSSFFSGLGNKLAAQAVSRKERAEQVRNARDAEKNSISKAEQDKEGESK